MWIRKVGVYELEDVGEVIQDFCWEGMMVMCWDVGGFKISVDLHEDFRGEVLHWWREGACICARIC